MRSIWSNAAIAKEDDVTFNEEPDEDETEAEAEEKLVSWFLFDFYSDLFIHFLQKKNSKKSLRQSPREQKSQQRLNYKLLIEV